MEELKEQLNDEEQEEQLNDEEQEEQLNDEEQEEQLNDEEQEEQLNDEEQEEQPEEKTVPLTALQKEREKLRNLKKENADLKRVVDRIMEGAGTRDPRELETKMDDLTLQQYIEQQGMDENTARVFLMQQKKLAELERSKKDVEYKDEISKLKDNPFYADIDEVSEDVIEYAKAKGLTVREAYNALFADQRAQEMARQKENEIMQTKKQNKKISALSSAGNAPAQKNTVKLSAQEAEYAKAAGMTPAEYAKYKNMK
jgi:hypothetical protein